MPGSGVSVTISVVDQASRQIDAINKRLASMTAPARRLHGQIQRFAKVTGIDRVVHGFRGMASTTLNVARNLMRVVAPLALITDAASVAGLIRLTTAFADFGNRLGITATNLGILPARLMALQGAARLAGTSGEVLTSGMQALGQQLNDMAAGRASMGFVNMWNALGVAARNADGSMKTSSQLLPQVADKIKAIRNPFTQAAVATRLFGAAGEQLLPFLRLGSAGIAEYVAEARRYGVMSRAQVAEADRLYRAQTRLSLSVQGLGNSIAARLAPVLGPLLDGLASWVAKNRQIIATKIADYVRQFAAWLESINWTKVAQGLQAFLADVNAIARTVGGWKTALEAIAVYIAGSWIATVSAPIVRLLRLLALVPGSGVTGAGVASALGIPLALSGDTANNAPAAAARRRMIERESLGYMNRKGVGYHPPPLSPQIESMVRAHAKTLGLAPTRMAALARADGGGVVYVRAAGAIGPMQLLPGTARDMGVDPMVPSQNINGGERYFVQLLRRFHGDYAVAQAAYNAGPQNAGVKYFARTGDPSHLPVETQRYIATIADYSARGAAASVPARGGSPHAPAGAIAPGGKAHLHVTLGGFPDGSRASAHTSGEIWGAPPLVRFAMPPEPVP